MASGRKAIPIEQHKTTGTFRPGRHLPKTSTDPDRGVPDCPDTLSDPAKAAWARFAALLATRRTLTRGDAASLELLCETYVEWRELSHQVRAEGRIYQAVTESGAIMKRPHPACAMLSDASRRLNALFAEFGFTPASRAKVPALIESKPGNPFAVLGAK